MVPGCRSEICACQNGPGEEIGVQAGAEPVTVIPYDAVGPYCRSVAVPRQSTATDVEPVKV